MPSVAVELEPGFVVGARLDGHARRVGRVALRELVAGALAPSPNKPNILSAEPVLNAIAGVAALVGNVGGRLGLLVPDVAARVAVLQFEALPEARREAESLVTWRMREFLPFPPEEARLSYQVLARQTGSVEVLGLAMRNSVVAEYEAALEAVNGGPALMLPASVALLPLLPEDKSGQILLHLCPGALTAVVVAHNRVRSWRTRALEGAAGQENLDEVAREAGRVLAACQDQLGVQVENVWFCARPPASMEMKAALAEILGRELRPLATDPARTSALSPEERQAFEHFGMPIAGLMANRND